MKVIISTGISKSHYEKYKVNDILIRGVIAASAIGFQVKPKKWDELHALKVISTLEIKNKFSTFAIRLKKQRKYIIDMNRIITIHTIINRAIIIGRAKCYSE